MLEDPQSSPTEHDQASPLAEMSSSARREYWRNLVTPKCQEPLEETLKPIVEILDNSFGTPSPWADQTQRAKMLSLFLRSITRETFEDLHAKRDEEPSAKMFLERMDREIRDAIPLLSCSGKSGLFRCGYPLGTGEGSLTELCVKDELSRGGPSAVIDLFSQCLTHGRPTRPWTEALLIAANTALREVSPNGTHRYVIGLTLLANPSEPFASRMKESFKGMGSTTPLNVLITAYNKAHLHPNVRSEIKAALLSETLDAIDLSTGSLLRDELATLRNSIVMPEIAPLAVPLVQRIGDAIQRGESAPTRDVESLKKLLVRRTASSFSEKGNAPDQSPTSSAPSVQDNPSLADVTDTTLHRESPPSQGTPEEAVRQLKTLSQEQLRPHLLLLLENGLENPASELSREFIKHLSTTGIVKLIVMRHVLESSDRSPEHLLQALEKRVHEELLLTVPTLNALDLTYLYKLCLQCEAPPREVGIVNQALRDALRLPEPADIPVGGELSDAGARVWSWIFHELQPDPALLNDLCRVHLPKMLARLARNISNENRSQKPEKRLGVSRS